MKFVNLTPHALNVHASNGEVVPIPPDGQIARVGTTSIEIAGGCDQFRLVATVYGEVTGLPDPVEDTIYIVSSMVADRVLDRDDVVAPGELVRDEKGNPIGCRGLKTSGGGL